MRYALVPTVLTIFTGLTASADCSLSTTVGGKQNATELRLVDTSGAREVYAASSAGYSVVANFDSKAGSLWAHFTHPNRGASEVAIQDKMHSIDDLDGAGGADGEDEFKFICGVK